MRPIILPEALDFDTPGRRDHWVALPQDSIWGDHLIPLTILVGPEARAGEGLVAFGSTHGNEYEGPVALRHVLRGLDPARVRGRIVIVPVLNPAAFRTGTRDSVAEDGVNLNRAFVPGAGAAPLGGITHRIAAFVRQYLWPQVSVVLDLHAGGQVARFLPCASFHAVADPVQHALIEATARDFGAPAILTYQNETPGLLTSEAERLGKVTVGCELGWGGAVQPAGVGFARRGVLAALVRHGQYAGDLPPPVPGQRHLSMVERACFVPAPFAGHYEPLRDCGAEVRQGEAVGLLHDFDRIDLDPEPIRAGCDGVVVAQAWGAPVRAGQHVLVVGTVVPPRRDG
ncbi:succinylglutamate desuccinylase/aspartoacylase family protein [Roseomonas sp. OT10]|uniref:succinylglutamate desuccinylase/aspartoacylase domain-containing protein n=1 Tax=Roseomonas cutis TaxID=2897332 RepID=UPI001E341486|nr:succinylglutamate desuccinylase/aspartoacylase family protein [Roseomonas sp. OT10]UFN48536.1 succinylglutamate desuccinylase/aspartoacylase family protein [Roseomonas sp. OT10]